MENPGFAPAFHLANPHVQSVVASRPPRSLLVDRCWRILSPSVEDTIVDAGEGVRLLGHYSRPPDPGNGGLVILIHGWEGSTSSVYMKSATLALLEDGYAVFRLNLRDHGDSHHLNEELFHSCRLAEVIRATSWITERYSPARLSLAGFSLGGNFALRVAAAATEYSLDLHSVVAICPVLDPAQTMAALDGGWVFYRKFFIWKWRDSLQKKMQCFPELYRFRDLNRFTRLEAMTDHFVRHYTEYDDLQSYLRGYAITGDRLETLRVPSCVLLADDDPVIPVHGLSELHRTEALKVFLSQRGGHCGFIEALNVPSWLDNFIVRQLEDVTKNS
ncbi:MAG: alpha/beta fold hydrolase [Gammaproteobacteria bacterium]|jgi:hypothetical protein|nr:alpha/beta fold hydrolase [Gammaproteobacteria bacterium]MDP6617639.1 alpha/beta fold hydrolase [Gammaproteobacteria bacterium]MDP6694516.1 alpha/beta fold hydrolase [Gammaproteobacteria bacterium]